jgi:acetyl-CoA synthetase
MLSRSHSYETLVESFRWQVPEHYNIGLDICDKWAHQRYRLALIYEDERGREAKYTFWELARLSNRLANGMVHDGFRPGDRAGILLSQCVETALAHIAIYKLGGIALPLFTLFGPDALTYRLADSQAKFLITDEANLPKVLSIRDALPELTTVWVTADHAPEGVRRFWRVIEAGKDAFKPVQTRAEDPALIIYTSGTTGPPKGALHAHRVLLGHLPGVEMPHNFFPREDDLFWTPADWAWIGGLIDVLFPSWHHGIPVVARRAKKFDPEEVFHLLAKHGIRNAFMPPTALKMMRQVNHPRSRHSFQMRSIGSGGETLGEELLQWGMETMGIQINEFYGQTEANLVVANCFELMEVRPGSMGRAVPGHTVAVVDEAGHPVAPGTVGEIAVCRPDPVMFLKYWNNSQATKAKFVGDWCLTGDLGKQDTDGYFWFVGRKDDVITSSGYRIGPAEIEDCILKHPAVSMAAVVGSPDPLRTEVVKAFIVLKAGTPPSPELTEEIKNFVKVRLAAHEYPREIEFIQELPMTATGKIMRRELKKLELDRKQMPGA